MSRQRAFLFALSLLGLGYVVSFLYANMGLDTDAAIGIHPDLYYVFYPPLLYFLVYTLWGRPMWGKYGDALCYAGIAVLRVIYDYVFHSENPVSGITAVSLGLVLLLLIIKMTMTTDVTTECGGETGK